MWAFLNSKIIQPNKHKLQDLLEKEAFKFKAQEKNSTLCCVSGTVMFLVSHQSQSLSQQILHAQHSEAWTPVVLLILHSVWSLVQHKMWSFAQDEAIKISQLHSFPAVLFFKTRNVYGVLYSVLTRIHRNHTTGLDEDQWKSYWESQWGSMMEVILRISVRINDESHTDNLSEDQW